MAVPKKRLGEVLVEAGLIDAAQLEAALGYQRTWGCKLGQALTDLRLVTEAQILSVLSERLGYQGADVSTLRRTSKLDEALRLVPPEMAQRLGVLPLGVEGSSLTVAMSDPTNVAVIDEVAFRAGRSVKVVLATHRALETAVQRFYFGGSSRRPMTAIDLDESVEDATIEPTLLAPAPPRPGTRAARPAAAGSTTSPTAPAGTAAAGAAPGARPGGAPPAVAANAPAATPASPAPPPRAGGLLAALERIGGGGAGLVEGNEMASALARLLVRKGLVTEQELLEELTRRR